MIDKFAVEISVDRFNAALDKVKESGDFDECITLLNESRKNIERLETVVKMMKQEEHDLTQDVYNKFKDKGYVSTIKFE
jgi:archaellum component FlaC